ncbi:hypothetical protein PMIN06_006643 [Paraphaeosphaeria minitans]
MDAFAFAYVLDLQKVSWICPKYAHVEEIDQSPWDTKTMHFLPSVGLASFPEEKKSQLTIFSFGYHGGFPVGPDLLQVSRGEGRAYELMELLDTCYLVYVSFHLSKNRAKMAA